MTSAALAAALLAVATMPLPDAALAGSLPKAGTNILGARHASAPSRYEHSGDYLVHVDLKRRTGAEKKEFKVNPDYFRFFSPSCMAKPRSAPDRRTREGMRRIAGCKSWTCTQWYAPLNCCVRWDCSIDVFR
jgi:hypothetical protein